MKKYKVTATFQTVCHVFIDAESLEEAQALAHDLDGEQFEPAAQDCWQIESVKEHTQ